METLRSRVGHISIVTLPAGADVTVDDQAAGRTPLDRPLLVSIGHRKVTATVAGRPAVTKFVDVATDDNVSVTLQLPDAALPPPVRGPTPALTLPPTQDPPSHAGATWRIVGWTTTGVLAAGALTMGLLADKASSDSSAARNAYPATAATLNHDASVTSTYSLVADSLAVAAAVIGSITLVSTFTASGDHVPDRAARVVIGPGSARLDVTF